MFNIGDKVMPGEKLYPIQPDLGDFRELSSYYPGVTPDGDQIIIFAENPMMWAYRFDSSGNYIGCENRDVVNWHVESSPAHRREARLSNVLAWAKELALTPATIYVHKFSSGHDSPCLCIADVPRQFDDDDLATLGSEEERERLFKWWQNLCAFVLCWEGSEYTLDGKGARFQ